MLLDKFDYNLPPELIAQEPPKERGGSRLLLLNRKSGSWSHHMFSDLPELLSSNDLLIMNNSKVFPSRLLGWKPTGGSVECFLLREHSAGVYECLLKSSKKKDGIEFELEGGAKARVVGRIEGAAFLVAFDPASLGKYQSIFEYAQEFGHIPLPPYIEREDRAEDFDRYQTVYAEQVGSVAAPTAGLHFTNDTFSRLEAKGIRRAEVTLHVGIGTFQPIRAENIEEHTMHTEYYSISTNSGATIQEHKRKNGRCIAVGTTSVRTVESAVREKSFTGENKTNLFIYPGYQFQVVDALITNFHQPKTSLLVMISAFAGRELVMEAYNEAIKAKYRFFSYGDCMLIL